MLQSPDSPRDALPHPAPTLVHFHEHYLKHLLPALDAAAPPGLTSTQGWILADVAREGDMTAARLAERRQLDPAYLSRTLGEMEEAGLLARRPSIRDGRKRPISLTAAGRAVARQVEASFREALERRLAHLHPDQVRELVSSLETTQELLDPGPATSAPGGEDVPTRRIRLRPPRPGDLGWIIHRHGVIYHQEMGWGARFEALVAGVVQELIRGFDPALDGIWIAHQGHRRAGSVAVMGDRNRPGVALLRLLLVEPRFRGMGIGGRLVRRCTRFARRAGFQTLRLWTDSGLDAARRLYQTEGYRLVKEEPHDHFGEGLLGQYWELDLGGTKGTGAGGVEAARTE